MNAMNNSHIVAKVATEILRVAKDRLDYAVESRNSAGLGHVTKGMVLTELIMSGLPPSPGEKQPVKKTAAAEKLRVVAS